MSDSNSKSANQKRKRSENRKSRQQKLISQARNPSANAQYPSAGYWAFTEGFLACEINFCCRLFRFSLLFRFWFALFEFESDIFLFGQHEKCLKRPALAGNKLFKQIRFTCSEQFIHLFALDRPLQNEFARSEVARLVWTD